MLEAIQFELHREPGEVPWSKATAQVTYSDRWRADDKAIKLAVIHPPHCILVRAIPARALVCGKEPHSPAVRQLLQARSVVCKDATCDAKSVAELRMQLKIAIQYITEQGDMRRSAGSVVKVEEQPTARVNAHRLRILGIALDPARLADSVQDTIHLSKASLIVGWQLESSDQTTIGKLFEIAGRVGIALPFTGQQVGHDKLAQPMQCFARARQGVISRHEQVKRLGQRTVCDQLQELRRDLAVPDVGSGPTQSGTVIAIDWRTAPLTKQTCEEAHTHYCAVSFSEAREIISAVVL
jgi:hypothetical protein